MHGQRQTAVRTLERGRALAAEHRAREPSTIEEHDRLFAPGQRLSHGVAQRGAQYDIRPRGRVLARPDLAKVTLLRNGTERPFYRFAASVHYEVEHFNPSHADVAAHAHRTIHIRDGQVEKDVSRAA